MLHRGGNIQFYVMHVRVSFTYLILKLSTPDIKFTLVCTITNRKLIQLTNPN